MAITAPPHKQIKVTVSKRLFDQIQARADDLGTTKANYLRNLVLEDLREAPCDRLSATDKIRVVETGTENKKRSDKRVADGGDQRVSLQELLDLI